MEPLPGTEEIKELRHEGLQEIGRTFPEVGFSVIKRPTVDTTVDMLLDTMLRVVVAKRGPLPWVSIDANHVHSHTHTVEHSYVGGTSNREPICTSHIAHVHERLFDCITHSFVQRFRRLRRCFEE